MEKQEFKVKFTVEKEFSLKSSGEIEAKEEAIKLLKKMLSENFDIIETNIFNITEHNEKC